MSAEKRNRVPKYYQESPYGSYKRASELNEGDLVYLKLANQDTNGNDHGLRHISHLGVTVVRIDETKQKGNPKVIVRSSSTYNTPTKDYAIGAGTITQAPGGEGLNWGRIRIARERYRRGLDKGFSYTTP